MVMEEMNMRRKVANTRIDLRTTSQRKHFFELAAFMGGYESLSSFMSEASEMLAKKVLDEVEDSRVLSEADRDLLISFLNNAPDPNPVLKAAYDRVAKLCHLNQNGETVYQVEGLLVKSSNPPGK